MAVGYSDGSLIVDTGLNNAGFFRDAKQFKGAVESLKNTVNRVGQDMVKSGVAYTDALTGSKGAVNKLNSSIEESKRLLEDEIREIQRVGEMANEYRKLARAEEEMTAAQKNLDWDSEEFKSLDVELGNVADRMRELNSASNSFEGLRIGKWAESGMFARLQYEFSAAERRLNALNTAQIEAQESVTADTQAQKAAADAASEAAQSAQTEADALESVAEAAKDAATALESKAAAENKAPRHIITDEEYEALVRAGTAISEAQRNMERAAGINVVRETLSISEAITREIQRTEEAYQGELAKINAIESAMEANRDVARETSEATAQNAANIGDRFASALNSARSAAARFWGAFEAYYSKAPAESNAVAQGMEQVADNAGSAARAVESVGRQTGGAAARLAKLAAGGVLGFLRKLASGAKNAAVQLAKLSGKALANGIKAIGSAASRAGQALLGMGKRARQSNGGIQLSLRNILRYGLGIRSLFVLFNRLRSAIKEGFETLANYDPRVKAALASLKGALNGLKGSLAGAFAPILTAIAPALTTFINLLAQAINSIGMFMAALTGQGYYMAAKGIEAVDSAAGGASGSVKELKRQLAGFDELNILSAGTSGGGSGGGGSAGAGYVYDRIPLEGGIADFVQRMKQLFQAGEYEEIGQVIADGINGAFQRVRDYIRWENIGGTLTGYVDAFAGIFNGMVGRIKWKDIGKTFGDGLNTIVNTLERWYKKLDFKNVGTAIGEALNGMVERVDFAKAGATLAGMLTAKLVVAANALATFNWEQFGPKLAEGFNSFIGKLDEVIGDIDWEGMARRMVRGLNKFIRHVEWRELGDRLGERVDGLFGMIGAAVKEFDWEDSAKRLALALNHMVRKVDWAKVGASINALAKGALEWLHTAVAEFDWRGLGARIRQMLEAIDWTQIREALRAIFKDLFSGLGELAMGVLLEDGKARAFASGLMRMLTVSVGVDFQPNVSGGAAYSNGGLLDYLQNVFAPGADAEARVALCKKGWTSLEEYVGTDAPLKTLVNLAKGNYRDLSSFVGAKKPVTALVDLARSGWDTVAQWASGYGGERNVSQGVQLVKSLWQTVSGWVNGLKGNTKVEQIVGLIRSAWSTVSAWVNGLKGSAKVEQAVDLVKGWIGSVSNYLGLNNLESSVDMGLQKSWNGDPVRALGLDDLTTTIKVGLKTTNNSIELSGGGGGRWTLQTKAQGGIVTAGGVSRAFANGGMVSAGGRARWWNSIPKYAGGTSRAHGTLFAAGEAGPEIVGHIGGRTEVLNQSQLAQTMRGAVTGGMIAALRGIEFRLPAMATGSVVPYDVSAQIARSSAELRSTLDANNEDLIQTIISVIGAQTTAIVAALQAQQRNGGTGGLNVQQVINEINRRTQMFAASPLN